MGAESFLNLLDHSLKHRQGLTDFAAPHEVTANVELCADLDVADLVVTTKLSGFTVEF